MGVRLVVTGQDPAGKAIVASDDELSPQRLDVFPNAEFFLLWGSHDRPALPSEGERPTTAWIPGPIGARFGISVLPSGYGANAEELRAGLAEIDRELPGLALTLDLDEPGMHTTDTIDFVMVTSGTVTLELDGGERVELATGDCVVQNGTRHAWRNAGPEPCTLVITMVGADRRT